jgi:uncharacterized protein (DUF952 family)
MHAIFQITQQEQWEQAQSEGAYRAQTLDTQGFIHCSTRWQVLRVANNFYRGQDGLVLLTIDTDKLQSPMRYEPPVPNAQTAERFPHIYGPINLDAVVSATPFAPGEDGLFTMP